MRIACEEGSSGCLARGTVDVSRRRRLTQCELNYLTPTTDKLIRAALSVVNGSVLIGQNVNKAWHHNGTRSLAYRYERDNHPGDVNAPVKVDKPEVTGSGFNSRKSLDAATSGAPSGGVYAV
jgi:hypothetical protein